MGRILAVCSSVGSGYSHAASIIVLDNFAAFLINATSFFPLTLRASESSLEMSFVFLNSRVI